MNAQPRLEREAVLAALRAGDVIARFQIKGRTKGDEYRCNLCPKCGPRSREDAVAINLLSGKWSDHAHGCGGDILDLVAGLSGLDTKRDFQRVLELAADIAGVGPGADPADVRRSLEQRRQLEAQQRERELRDRQLAVQRAASIWRGLPVRSPAVGEPYLARRGLDPARLIARGAVRFLHESPAVALYSSRGQVLNVVCRKVAPEPDAPKTPGLKGAPSLGTLVGRLDTLIDGQDVVLTEGVADTLAGVLAWPGALVVGAHSWVHLGAIGSAIARIAPRHHGVVRLVPHRDPPADGAPAGVGRKGADEAAVQLRPAGIEPVFVDVAPHKDLAEAWSAGWRP